MKFAIGYQEPENRELFSNIAADYREHLCEVYFALPGSPSGRADSSHQHSIDILEDELTAIRGMGIKLDLLFNANCYGGGAVSLELEHKVNSVLEYLDSIDLLPDVVTTTSPMIANVIKNSCPVIERRASVNMRIDCITALEYLADTFDSFYIRRDLQRNLETLAKFREWSDRNGKKMGMLLNSGCLRHCPYQTFHDNLVAHDKELRQYENTAWNPHLCWQLYRKEKRYTEFLKSSWIRPEDVKYYEEFADFGKLATRQHHYPRIVLGAYCNGSYDGNLLNLTEPDYSSAFAPLSIENRLFPEDWHLRTAHCSAVSCLDCRYCEKVMKDVAVEVREELRD